MYFPIVCGLLLHAAAVALLLLIKAAAADREHFL